MFDPGHLKRPRLLVKAFKDVSTTTTAFITTTTIDVTTTAKDKFVKAKLSGHEKGYEQLTIQQYVHAATTITATSTITTTVTSITATTTSVATAATTTKDKVIKVKLSGNFQWEVGINQNMVYVEILKLKGNVET